MLQLVEPKTDRSRRALELPRFAVASLKAHRTRQLEDRLLAGSRWQETGLVFTSGIGTPLSAPKVTVAFQALLKRAGLPRQRFHDLRHACASLLFAQGVDPKMVMDTLGPSQISTTLDIYTHILPAMRKDVAQWMDAVLNSVPS